jgi:hypothetical protein
MNNWIAVVIAHQLGLLDAAMFSDIIGDARHNITSYPQLKNTLLRRLENYPAMREMNIFRDAFDGEGCGCAHY